MAYLDAMLQAAAEDAADRGLPAEVGGDDNAQPCECPALSPLSCAWRDAVDWAVAEDMVDSAAARLLRGYSLLFPGHRPFTLAFLVCLRILSLLFLTAERAEPTMPFRTPVVSAPCSTLVMWKGQLVSVAALLGRVLGPWLKGLRFSWVTDAAACPFATLL